MTGTLAVIAYVQVSGPLFDGQAEEAVTRFGKEARQAIADRGLELLRAVPMDKTGRGTGAFSEHLKIIDKGSFLRIPSPAISGVTWGPWLEGTSKRNQSTKFRGYHPFRKARTQLDLEATGIAEKKLREFLPQMGGS